MMLRGLLATLLMVAAPCWLAHAQRVNPPGLVLYPPGIFTGANGVPWDPAGSQGLRVFPVVNYGFSSTATAAANTAAIQNAIAAACSSAGASTSAGTVKVPPGSYTLDTSGGAPRIPCLGVTLEGAGSQATFLTETSGSGVFFNVGVPASSALQPYGGFGLIRGMRLFSSITPTSGCYITLDHSNVERVEDVSMGREFCGINVHSTTNTIIANVTMGGNNTTAGTVGILFDHGLVTHATTGAAMGATAIPVDSTSGLYNFQIVTGDAALAGNTRVVQFDAASKLVTITPALTGTLGSTTLTFTDDNNYAVYVNNTQIGGEGVGSSATLATCLKIQNGERIYVDSHFECSQISNDGLIVQADTAGSRLRHLHIGGHFYSVGGSCVHLIPLGGYGGINGYSQFTEDCDSPGTNAGLSVKDGFRADDTSTRDDRICGHYMNGTAAGIDLEGGVGFGLCSGMVLAGNNTIHLLLGNVTHVSGAGLIFARGLTTNVHGDTTGPVTYNVQISGTSDFIDLTGSDFSGAATGDLTLTSVQPHIIVSGGTSDQTGGAPGIPTQIGATNSITIKPHAVTNGPSVFLDASGISGHQYQLLAEGSGNGGGAGNFGLYDVTNGRYVAQFTSVGNQTFTQGGLSPWAQSGAAATTSSATLANIANIKVPAGMMLANSMLKVNTAWSFAGNTNAKVFEVSISATQGDVSGGRTVMFTTSTSTNTNISAQFETCIHAANSVSVQFSISQASCGAGLSAGASNAGAIDTTADWWININGDIAAADTLTLKGYTIDFRP